MRHSTKMKINSFAWDSKNFSFTADIYTAKLCSPQRTVIIEQIDNQGDCQRWKKSFRSIDLFDGGIEADMLASKYIKQVKKNSLDADKIMKEEKERIKNHCSEVLECSICGQQIEEISFLCEDHIP